MLRSHLAVDGFVVALIVFTLNTDNLSIICLSMPLVASDRLFLPDLFHTFFAYFVNA
ncbi:hypothetical protein [Nostoc sp. ATCC 53789]|uniref:hypothetical protein n=1 Tax=Nostoc sp. ATCC 53789 TaxID=76335 RepID=UPI00132F26A4|nr:hypothetical protein [Nostoc sp. ATCC 53789]QHG20662.1 hypothetical protein GJB62_32890 [Nostoc sp. ATCC 53789]